MLVQKEGTTRKITDPFMRRSNSSMDEPSRMTYSKPSKLDIGNSKSFNKGAAKQKSINFDEYFNPVLGKPTVFGDLEVVNEAVGMNQSYMQPTKAFIKKQRTN